MESSNSKLTPDDIIKHREMLEMLHTTPLADGKVMSIDMSTVMKEMKKFCDTFCLEGEGDCPMCKTSDLETRYLQYYNLTVKKCPACYYIKSKKGRE